MIEVLRKWKHWSFHTRQSIRTGLAHLRDKFIAQFKMHLTVVERYRSSSKCNVVIVYYYLGHYVKVTDVKQTSNSMNHCSTFYTVKSENLESSFLDSALHGFKESVMIYISSFYLTHLVPMKASGLKVDLYPNYLDVSFLKSIHRYRVLSVMVFLKHCDQTILYGRT
jgi:hypothetical protein